MAAQEEEVSKSRCDWSHSEGLWEEHNGSQHWHWYEPECEDLTNAQHFSDTTRVLLLGDSTDLNTLLDNCEDAHGTLDGACDQEAFKEDGLCTCTADTWVAAAASTLGVHPTGPWFEGLNVAPAHRIKRALRYFRQQFGVDPDAVMFAANMWDLSRVHMYEPQALEHPFDSSRLDEWLRHAKSLMVLVSEEVPAAQKLTHTTCLVALDDCATRGKNSRRPLGQRVHLVQLNAALRAAAAAQQWQVVDLERMLLGFAPPQTYLRDEYHPAAWVLLEAFKFYLAIARTHD